MITLENPQIILLALAIVLGALAAVFFTAAEYRRVAMIWHIFQDARATRQACRDDFQETSSTDPDIIGRALAQVKTRLDRWGPIEQGVLMAVIAELSQTFAETDPYFDAASFMQSCEVEDQVLS